MITGGEGFMCILKTHSIRLLAVSKSTLAGSASSAYLSN